MTARIRRLTLASLLVAVMLVLGYLESLLPVSPIPGIKPGLANCALLIALYWLGPATSFAIMVVKVTLLGFLFGNPMMIVYSLAGGTLSLVAMSLLIRMPGVSAIGAGIAGGVLHNVGQVAVAAAILQTPGLLYYLGLLMPVGAGMGLITGTLARLLLRAIPPQTRIRNPQETK